MYQTVNHMHDTKSNAVHLIYTLKLVQNSLAVNMQIGSHSRSVFHWIFRSSCLAFDHMATRFLHSAVFSVVSDVLALWSHKGMYPEFCVTDFVSLATSHQGVEKLQAQCD